MAEPKIVGAGCDPRDGWYSTRDLFQFADHAPPDRFCDLILTGGVTSAIAYPGLVAVLASRYRFHAVGGSSSGAGIAALAAAAEYRRRHGSDAGFRLMLERVQRLSEKTWRGTGLSRLFQPSRVHAPLFECLVSAFSRPGEELIAFARSAMMWFVAPWVGFWAILIACLLPPIFIRADSPTRWVFGWTWVEVFACGGPALFLGVLFGALSLGLAFLGAVRTDYGLCTGIAPPGKPVDPDAPAITDWLHGLIQEVAGRAADDDPLTFEDLARAPGSPRAVFGAGGADARKGIALEMYSANVTHGRPYRFPLAEDEVLYFRPSELRRVMPPSVVAYLIKTCTNHPDGLWPEDQALSPADQKEDGRWRLPCEKLPVILAARMSLSFPLLFTAVRLWAPHQARRNAAPNKRDEPVAQELHPCIFMDGGLCSNFPIHLFDSAVPAWPTFGVCLRHNLSKRDRPSNPNEAPSPVSLAKDTKAGREERWIDFDRARGSFRRVSSLFDAMLSTVKDWNDNASARLPGVWDRVVEIELETGEGGLNIAMKPGDIEKLIKLGVDAGRQLVARFSDANVPNGLAAGWNEHRWARMTRLRFALAKYLDGFGWSLAPGRHAESMDEQIRRAIDESATKDEPPLTETQAAALRQFLRVMVEAERSLKAPAVALPDPPHPQPEMRLRAPL